MNGATSLTLFVMRKVSATGFITCKKRKIKIPAGTYMIAGTYVPIVYIFFQD